MRVIKLCKGAGNGVDSACLMTAASIVNGDEVTGDASICICNVIRAFVIPTNDLLTDELRSKYYSQFIFQLPGTATTIENKIKRAHIAAKWAKKFAANAAAYVATAAANAAAVADAAYVATGAAANAAAVDDAAYNAADAAFNAAAAVADAAYVAADTAANAATVADAADATASAAANAAYVAANAAVDAADAAYEKIAAMCAECIAEMIAVTPPPKEPSFTKTKEEIEEMLGVVDV